MYLSVVVPVGTFIPNNSVDSKYMFCNHTKPHRPSIEISPIPFASFFQEKDGIRDVAVTGVQTCALPICRRGMRTWRTGPPTSPAAFNKSAASRRRSEERRVGKEGRSRWWAYH